MYKQLLTKARLEYDTIKMQLNVLEQNTNKFKLDAEAAQTELKSNLDMWEKEKEELNSNIRRRMDEQNQLQDQLIEVCV